jgi:hypothetical protein
MSDNYFKTLSEIDVSKKTEKKAGLTYLSWAFAWCELKLRHPDAEYTVYENKDGWNYHTDGKTCWVKTGVKVQHIEHIEYLPIMDNRNKSIIASAVTSFDVNKAIQRSLTKAVARHGLGLYIYAGEDLPETDEKPDTKPANPDQLRIDLFNEFKSLRDSKDENGISVFDETKRQAMDELLKTVGLTKMIADIKKELGV